MPFGCGGCRRDVVGQRWTWAGAVANLKAGWAPLWVWDSAAAPAGNRELLAEGGRPLESASAEEPLALGLGASVSEHLELTASTDAEMESAIERYLSAPRSEADVCAALGLTRGRARTLLKLGVASGRLVREGKPFRYTVASVADQPRLFDAA